MLGSVSSDNTGIYLYSSIDEKIYLVSTDISSSFDFSALDLASTDAVSPITDKSELSGYVEDGSLLSFDKLSVSGNKFDKPVAVRSLSEDEASKTGMAYKVIEPVDRFADADSIELLLSAFTSGISVSGVYSFDTDAASLRTFRLDDPDYILTLTLGQHSFTYKFSLCDDGFYAVFGDGMNTIKKVSSSAVQFLSLKSDDIYNKMVYLRSISEIKNMTFSFGEEEYSFDISENGEDAEEKYTVYYGKKRITSDYFQNFYMHFVSLSVFDFSSGSGDLAEMTVKITDNEDKVQTIVFYKSSATDYLCFVDGAALGRVTASSYNELVSDIKAVSKNKDVEDR